MEKYVNCRAGNAMENNINEAEELKESETAEKNENAKAGSERRAEIVSYLIFGVLTTIVGWAVYFVIMAVGRAVLDIPYDDAISGKYVALYTTAQVVQWVCAVLFAFFTNRKWVFKSAEKGKNIFLQLATFAGGRVATFVLDFVVTFFGGLALTHILPFFNEVTLFGITLNLNEVGAKVFAAVLVIIGNYFFSKFFVFKDKKKS